MLQFLQFLKTDHIRSDGVGDAEGCSGYCPQPPGAARIAVEEQAVGSAGGGNVMALWWQTGNERGLSAW